MADIGHCIITLHTAAPLRAMLDAYDLIMDAMSELPEWTQEKVRPSLEAAMELLQTNLKTLKGKPK